MSNPIKHQMFFKHFVLEGITTEPCLLPMYVISLKTYCKTINPYVNGMSQLSLTRRTENGKPSYRISENGTGEQILLPIGGPRVLVGGHGALVLLLAPPAVRVHRVQAVTLRDKAMTSAKNIKIVTVLKKVK